MKKCSLLNVNVGNLNKTETTIINETTLIMKFDDFKEAKAKKNVS